MDSSRLKKARQKFDAEDAVVNRRWKALSRAAKTAAIGVALKPSRYSKLASDFVRCGDEDGWGNIYKCRCFYCMKCFNDTVGRQQDFINQALVKYPTEQKLRNNIRLLTILFSVFPFDVSGSFPVFPMATAIAAKDDAQKQLNRLRNLKRFAGLRWRGGFSWEAIHLLRLTDKKQRTLQALIKASQAYQPATKPSGQWQHHRILFHAHLVVDLDGIPAADVADYCHKAWGNTKKALPVPDGAELRSLYTKMAVPKSLVYMANYPFRNQFQYKDAYFTPLEPKVLGALCDGLTTLNRKGMIQSQYHWK